jgi:hypothetical protein
MVTQTFDPKFREQTHGYTTQSSRMLVVSLQGLSQFIHILKPAHRLLDEASPTDVAQGFGHFWPQLDWCGNRIWAFDTRKHLPTRRPRKGRATRKRSIKNGTNSINIRSLIDLTPAR